MTRTERVARAMFEQHERKTIEANAELRADPSMWMTWETANEPTRAPWLERATAALTAIDKERDALREALANLEAASSTVLDGLNERIETAPYNCVPVFAGIADLHTALHQARSLSSVRN